MKIFAWILEVVLARAFLFHDWVYIVWPDFFTEMVQQESRFRLISALRSFPGYSSELRNCLQPRV